MTIKRLLLGVLLMVAISSVLINTFVLNTLTDRYFVDLMKDRYETHLQEIIEYSKKAIINDDFSLRQMYIELETHLNDPITRIKLYDEQESLLIDVGHVDSMMMGMMRNLQSSDVDHYELVVEGVIIGHLNITRNSKVEESIAIRLFKSNLVANSLYSIAITFIVTILLGYFISRKVSSDLIDTAKTAAKITEGKFSSFQTSYIREINQIQISLSELDTRLKIKQKSRKALVDELVHQTRTPLTILKTHIEGFQDGLIDLSYEEVNVCENQIENLTSIITNVGELIDGYKEIKTVSLSTFDFSKYLNGIINSVKAQFDSKHIKLIYNSKQQISIISDKYLLGQVIYNILNNAYKYTNEYGQVSIHYKLVGSKIVMEVTDDGIGIDSYNLSKIFDAYYRIDNNQTNGDGIGLYISKQNMNILNGEIQVKSKMNEGTTFIITIPIETKI